MTEATVEITIEASTEVTKIGLTLQLMLRLDVTTKATYVVSRR